MDEIPSSKKPDWGGRRGCHTSWCAWAGSNPRLCCLVPSQPTPPFSASSDPTIAHTDSPGVRVVWANLLFTSPKRGKKDVACAQTQGPEGVAQLAPHRKDDWLNGAQARCRWHSPPIKEWRRVGR